MVMNGVLQNKIYVMQDKVGTTMTFEKSTLEEKYLGNLGVDKVDGCMSMHSISKFSKFLINRIITFDKAVLVEQCKSGTGREACEESEFVVEDLETRYLAYGSKVWLDRKV